MQLGRNQSLKWQIASVFMGLTILLLITSYIITNFFMEGFFISQTRRQLIHVHDNVRELLLYINETFDGNSLTFSDEGNDVYLEILKQCSINNISIYLYTSSGKIGLIRGNIQNDDTKEIFDRLESASFENSKILQKTPEYMLQLYKDKKLNTDYMELISNYDGDYVFIMRIDLQSIKQNVALSNQFLRYAILMVIPLSFVIIWYVSLKITKPIILLSDISKKMIRLDFDAKFTGNETNEIGVLGSNINKLSDVLEETISQLRTANANLKHDIKKKEENEKKISEFVADLSHELKTPIALIQGYAEGLKEFIEDGDAECREFYCDVIVDESCKMNAMLKQLINLNCLELDYQVLEMQRFDLVNMTQNILNSYTHVKQQRNVSVNFVPSDKVINAWGDQFKITEVINNYITNALDHVVEVDDTGKRIEIVIKKQGEKARFEIFNTGSPIPEEDLDRLWTKFFKVDRARNRQFGGSGIGLSIVQAIMKLHNQGYGVINFQNGVQFFFELDLA